MRGWPSLPAAHSTPAQAAWHRDHGLRCCRLTCPRAEGLTVGPASSFLRIPHPQAVPGHKGSFRPEAKPWSDAGPPAPTSPAARLTPSLAPEPAPAQLFSPEGPKHIRTQLLEVIPEVGQKAQNGSLFYTDALHTPTHRNGDPQIRVSDTCLGIIMCIGILQRTCPQQPIGCEKS